MNFKASKVFGSLGVLMLLLNPAAARLGSKTSKAVVQPPPPNYHHERKLADPISTVILTGLISGAASKVGGEAFGWVLGLVGLDFWNDDSIDTTLAEIQEELDVQTQMLQGIEIHLQELKGQIDAAVVDIRDAITDAAAQSQFEVWVATLNQNVGDILGLVDNLLYFSRVTPSSAHQMDIQLFRANIFNTVPSSIRSIDGALMGTGFSEGMISLYSRIQFRNSADIDQYAQNLHMMLDYYQSYELLGLQLMFEYYNSASEPQLEGIEGYYETWKSLVDAQTDEYMRRAPMANIVETFSATGGRFGPIRDIQVSGNRIYFLAETGSLHSSRLDGSDLVTVDAVVRLNEGPNHGMTDYYDTSIFTVVGDSVLVGGLEPQSPWNRLKLAKFNKHDLTFQGEFMFSGPPPNAVNPDAYPVPRGFSVDKENSVFYMVQWAPEWTDSGKTSVLAVDIATMTERSDKSLVLKDAAPPSGSPFPGQMTIVGSTAFVATMVQPNFPEISVLDISGGAQEVTRLQGPEVDYTTPDGSLVKLRWTGDGHVFYAEIESAVANTENRAFASPLAYRDTNVAVAGGAIAYSTSPTSNSLYTLVDPRESLLNPLHWGVPEIITMPLDWGVPVTALHVSETGDRLYGAFEPGTVVVLEHNYPIAHAPEWTE